MVNERKLYLDSTTVDTGHLGEGDGCARERRGEEEQGLVVHHRVDNPVAGAGEGLLAGRRGGAGLLAIG